MTYVSVILIFQLRIENFRFVPLTYDLQITSFQYIFMGSLNYEPDIPKNKDCISYSALLYTCLNKHRNNPYM